MFDKTDKWKRKYACFVCGRQFLELAVMNEHVSESHEEGREYVRCPACDYCVRDVKLHFKVKHPDRLLPKTGQMRAMVWKDQGKDGKMKTRKPKFREGYFISIKNGGKEMHYRSGLEAEIYECLEGIPSVSRYDVEPISIPYIFEGKSHQYFPDISIHFADGHVEIWEVKPASQTSLPLNEAKWSAATQFCTARGFEFIVVTEQSLAKLRRLAKLRG